jgi:hypothetical protein
MGAIATLILSLTGSVAARVLTSLGIGIFSYAALSTLAQQVVSSAQGAFNGLAGPTLQIINLGGGGEALGIISAALISRASLAAIKTLRPI